MNHTSSHRWTRNGMIASVVIPATLAVLPGIRKQYGLATFSIPSMALMGGLWLLQRKMEKREALA